MADKRIDQLVAASTIGNNDLFVLEQNNQAKKLSGSTLASFVYNAAADKIDEVNQAVADAQDAVDSLEEQKNTIAETVASMAELGTDTTLTTPAMAADAKAAGDRIRAVEADALAALDQAEITGVPIATFDDGADDAPVKALTVAIEPVQSGSGDPSPENVRPITGWTGANIFRTGKNLLSKDQMKDMALANVPSKITWNSTYRHIDWSGYNFGDGIIFKGMFKPNTQYTMVATVYKTSGVGTLLKIVYSDGTYSGFPDVSAAGTKTTVVRTSTAGKTVVGITNMAYTGDMYLYVDESGIFEGALTAQDFEEYTGETYNVSFPLAAGTVYGGTLDVTNRKLTVDRIGISIDNTADWTRYDSGKFFVNDVTLSASSSGALAFMYITNKYLFRGSGQTQTSGIDADKRVYGQNTYGRIWVYDSSYDTLDEWKGSLETTPLQVVYPLAPSARVVYDLTPIEVKTLLALNNIWADTGNILDLIYRRKPISDAEIQSQINAIGDIIADREDTGVASKNYSNGSLILIGNTLVEVTDPIATGESIVVGTNCSETTVAAQIAYLKSIVNGLGNLAYLSYETL